MSALQQQLEEIRAAEKAQASRYRQLAALAEAIGDEATSQRLHDLHADEQHHLSRITARLVELGHTPVELGHTPVELVSTVDPGLALDDWEAESRRLEAAEVARYEALVRSDLDSTTRALAEQILEVELLHRDQLAGKWTLA